MELVQTIHQLPQNNEAEQIVLGAMLSDNYYISKAMEVLKKEDFYRGAHQIIYSAIIDLFNKDLDINLITLTNNLRSSKLLEKVGGASYLAELFSGYIRGVDFRSYLDIVSNKSLSRMAINEFKQLLDIGYENQDNPNEVIEQAERIIFSLSQMKNRNIENDVETVENILTRGMLQIEEFYKNKGSYSGVPSGLIELDKKTSGFQKGNMILLAARPSMGKTTLGLNICENAAIKAGKKVLFFSLEMSKEELILKMISSQTGIELSKIRTGDLSDLDWNRLAYVTGPLSNAKICIDDTPAISVAGIKSKCRRMKMETGLDLVVIDYLQLMTGDKTTENRQQEVSLISRAIKALAKEIECPVIALSQLSRAPEARADHRPIMSDLRESGSIEQDADVVLLLYRDEYYNKDTDRKNIAECIIAKQRNGETGTVELAWDGKHNRFGNLYKG